MNIAREGNYARKCSCAWVVKLLSIAPLNASILIGQAIERGAKKSIGNTNDIKEAMLKTNYLKDEFLAVIKLFVQKMNGGKNVIGTIKKNPWDTFILILFVNSLGQSNFALGHIINVTGFNFCED